MYVELYYVLYILMQERNKLGLVVVVAVVVAKALILLVVVLVVEDEIEKRFSELNSQFRICEFSSSSYSSSNSGCSECNCGVISLYI